MLVNIQVQVDLGADSRSWKNVVAATSDAAEAARDRLGLNGDHSVRARVETVSNQFGQVVKVQEDVLNWGGELDG